MAQPYIGEIRMFAGNFPPVGWMFCDGQLLPISENEAFYQVIGTTYGGDGESTFALPNLQSRIPLHFGNGGGGSYTIAEAAGVESVTLSTQQIPNHTHTLVATMEFASQTAPGGLILARNASADIYAAPDPPLTTMNAGAISPVGGSQPHENCQPFLCINYIISLFGLFPQPS